MKKALYLHGFLGGPQDLSPLCLEGFETELFDIRKILFEPSPIEYLLKETSDYEFVLGYSFGGRLAEELQVLNPDKAKKWIFVSSRHTPYGDEELKTREIFRNRLLSLVEEREEFFEFWKSLDLFSGHKMDEYRARHKLGYTPWSEEEVYKYLESFFNSPQIEPKKSKKSYYFHGLGDEKYSLEGEKLSLLLNVQGFKGGHRFLFESPEQFKVALREIVE